MRLLALVTDAFGGRGGISQSNRDLLSAICAHTACRELVVIPRLVQDDPGALPPKLDYRTRAARGRAAFVVESLRAARQGRYDAVICGHLNLLPAAALAARMQKLPLILLIYGLEAWDGGGRLRGKLMPGVVSVISISEFTKSRFVSWSGISPARVSVIPCCVDLSRFTPGAAPAELLARFGLTGRTILMTVARLAGRDRQKGFDEVIDVLPALVEEWPSLSYVIVGEGPDRARLEAKVAKLGLNDRVVFTGWVSNEEKRDLYRAADVFAMPGRREGFGIVYLEALACGVPVIASKADASQEVVRDGGLGVVVDPADPAELKSAILDVLRRGERGIPEGLERFSYPHFQERVHAYLDEILGKHISSTGSGGLRTARRDSV